MTSCSGAAAAAALRRGAARGVRCAQSRCWSDRREREGGAGGTPQRLKARCGHWFTGTLYASVNASVNAAVYASVNARVAARKRQGSPSRRTVRRRVRVACRGIHAHLGARRVYVWAARAVAADVYKNRVRFSHRSRWRLRGRGEPAAPGVVAGLTARVAGRWRALQQKFIPIGEINSNVRHRVSHSIPALPQLQQRCAHPRSFLETTEA